MPVRPASPLYSPLFSCKEIVYTLYMPTFLTGPSFLGSRADFLIDLIFLTVILIIPLLSLSLRYAKKRFYKAHKTIQTTLTVVLTIALILFEQDLASKGGLSEMMKGSRFEGSAFIKYFLYLHLTFAVSTAILWWSLLTVSFIRFPKYHRKVGLIGMVDMFFTAVTGIFLYIFCFVL